MINFLIGLRRDETSFRLPFDLPGESGHVFLTPDEAGQVAALLDARTSGDVPCTWGAVRVAYEAEPSESMPLSRVGRNLLRGSARLSLLLPETGGVPAPLVTLMDMGANFGVITQALRAQAPVADDASVTAEGDVLVFTLPSVKFEAQVSRSGFGDDLVRWLTRVAGTLHLGETVLWPARAGATVHVHDLLPQTLALTHTRLSGPVLLTVEDLEALIGDAVADQAGRQRAARERRAAIHG